MRTRIALATAMTVTSMITLFDIHPAGASTPSEVDIVSLHATRQLGTTGGRPFALTSLTTGTGGTQASADLSVNYLLWPKLMGLPLSNTAPAVKSATDGASGTPTPNGPIPATAPAPAPAPVVVPPPPTDATSTDTTDWQCIRIHESGDEYNDPSRPSGAYGILESTWESNGYAGWPYQAEAAVQDALALKLYNEFGWTPWSTRYVCGLS